MGRGRRIPYIRHTPTSNGCIGVRRDRPQGCRVVSLPFRRPTSDIIREARPGRGLLQPAPAQPAAHCHRRGADDRRAGRRGHGPRLGHRLRRCCRLAEPPAGHRLDYFAGPARTGGPAEGPAPAVGPCPAAQAGDRQRQFPECPTRQADRPAPVRAHSVRLAPLRAADQRPGPVPYTGRRPGHARPAAPLPARDRRPSRPDPRRGGVVRGASEGGRPADGPFDARRHRAGRLPRGHPGAARIRILRPARHHWLVHHPYRGGLGHPHGTPGLHPVHRPGPRPGWRSHHPTGQAAARGLAGRAAELSLASSPAGHRCDHLRRAGGARPDPDLLLPALRDVDVPADHRLCPCRVCLRAGRENRHAANGQRTDPSGAAAADVGTRPPSPSSW